MLYFADNIVLTLRCICCIGFCFRLFFSDSNGRFSEADAKSVPWTIFLIPQYVGTGHVPNCIVERRCIFGYCRIADDGDYFRDDQFKYDIVIFHSNETKEYHIGTESKQNLQRKSFYDPQQVFLFSMKNPVSSHCYKYTLL